MSGAVTDEDGGRLVPMPARRGDGLDAVIVGGGVIGLACAWRAARSGLRVRVLEREVAGAGASGVAAGMLAPIGEATWGEESLLGLALASAEIWPGFAVELESDSGLASTYERCGALHVALDRDEASELRRRFELMGSLDFDAEWGIPSRARELEPGLATACAAAIHAPGEAAVDPQALVEALVAAIENLGGEVRVGSEVVEPVIELGAMYGVKTADGEAHSAPSVVLATGCWSGALGWLPAEARPPVRPVKGQIVTLRGRPDEPVCRRIVASERVYIVPRADGRVVVGATVEELGFDVRLTAGGVHELLREAYRALPDVAELEFVEARAGMRPGTPDNAPLIGEGAIEGLVVATGHYRNGVLLAPATADAVAALLAGEQPSADLTAFAPGRFAVGEVVR